MGGAMIGRRTATPQRQKLDTSATLDATPQLKIVFLTPGFYHGGAERWILSLCRWLPHEVLGVVVANAGQIDPSMRADLRQLAPLIPYEGAGVATANEVLKSADVVIAWGFADLSLFRRQSAAKFIWVNHCSGPSARPLIDGCRNQVDHWAGVAEVSRTSFPDDLKRKMRVIHNGADIERTTPIRGRTATRSVWGLRDDQIAVGYVGRLSPEKRPEAVAEAVACLPENYVAVLVGGGRDEVNTRVRCERIAPGRCRFVGHQPRSIGDALAAIDVWVNASPSEGFCLSLLEAQLARVPCVSTPVGVLPELSEFGQIAVHVPVGCTGRAIADAVVKALEADGATVDRAFNLAWSRFTAPAMAARWDSFLREITADRH